VNRKVTYVRLHESAYSPATGDLGVVLPSQTKTMDNLSMHVEEIGLFLTFSFRGIRCEMLVPMANVKNMLLAPEDKPPTPAAKVVKAA
jgi:hypothetical protein